MPDVSTIEAPEFGLIASEVIFDRENGLVRKKIGKLDDFHGSLNDIPDRKDYQLYVQGSVDFLKSQKWGIEDSIPKTTVRLEGNEQKASGCDCWVDMDLIEGSPLTKTPFISEHIADQLADFLAKCIVMAEATRKEFGCIILPDLIGGVYHPKGQLTNFIIEQKTNKLWFVDVYPLAKLGAGWTSLLTRKKYAQSLADSVKNINHKQVLEQMAKLEKVIKS